MALWAPQKGPNLPRTQNKGFGWDTIRTLQRVKPRIKPRLRVRKEGPERTGGGGHAAFPRYTGTLTLISQRLKGDA